MLRASRSAPFYQSKALAIEELRLLDTQLRAKPSLVWRVRVPEGLEEAQAWVTETLAPWIRRCAAED